MAHASSSAPTPLVSDFREIERIFLDIEEPRSVDDVREASRLCLSLLGKYLNEHGRCRFGGLPVPLKILLNELTTVELGRPSALFAIQRPENTDAAAPTWRMRVIRANAAALLDLLMDKRDGPGLRRKVAAQKIADAIKNSGVRQVAPNTIYDWRAQAKNGKGMHANEYKVARAGFKSLLTKDILENNVDQILQYFTKTMKAHHFEFRKI